MMNVCINNQPTLTASGGRRLTYMRLSITDRCNLRCRYCMPPEGVPKLKHNDILSYEEYHRLLRLGAKLGLEKLRLTGGEPLLRRGLLEFIDALHKEKLFKDIRLTTNAILLAPLAEGLKKSGVSGINISLDALRPEVYADLAGRPGKTGEALFHEAWRGFEAALAQNFITKINCVPIRGRNDEELAPLAALALKYPVEVRFIEHMPIGPDGLWRQDGFYPAEALKQKLEETLGPLTSLDNKDPSAPAKMFKPNNAPGAVGFISAMSRHFCGDCNRLRLTADGKLKPCLLTSKEIDLRSPLRSHASDETILALFQQAAGYKPSSHLEQTPEESKNKTREMSLIGG